MAIFRALTAEINVAHSGILPHCPLNQIANACLRCFWQCRNHYVCTVVAAERKGFIYNEIKPEALGWGKTILFVIPHLFTLVIGSLLRVLSLYDATIRSALWRHPEIGGYTRTLRSKNGLEFFTYLHENKEVLMDEGCFSTEFSDEKTLHTFNHNLCWDILTLEGELPENPVVQEHIKFISKPWNKDLLNKRLQILHDFAKNQTLPSPGEPLFSFQGAMMNASILDAYKDLPSSQEPTRCEMIGLYEQIKTILQEKKLPPKELKKYCPTDDGEKALGKLLQPIKTTFELNTKTGLEYLNHFFENKEALEKEEGVDCGQLTLANVENIISIFWDILILDTDRLPENSEVRGFITDGLLLFGRACEDETVFKEDLQSLDSFNRNPELPDQGQALSGFQAIMITCSILSAARQLILPKGQREAEIFRLYNQAKAILQEKDLPPEELKKYCPTNVGENLICQLLDSVRTTYTLNTKTGIEYFHFFFSHTEELNKENFTMNLNDESKKPHIDQFLWDIATLNNLPLLVEGPLQNWITGFLSTRPRDIPGQELRDFSAEIGLIEDANLPEHCQKFTSLPRIALAYSRDRTRKETEKGKKSGFVVTYEALKAKLQLRLSSDQFKKLFPSDEGIELLAQLQTNQGISYLKSMLPPPPPKNEQEKAPETPTNHEDLLDSCLEELDLNLD